MLHFYNRVINAMRSVFMGPGHLMTRSYIQRAFDWPLFTVTSLSKIVTVNKSEKHIGHLIVQCKVCQNVTVRLEF